MELYISCPHCSSLILIMKNEINCAIFRHGYFKSNFTQIPPHESEEICTRLFVNEEIYGCGKPFKLINGVAEICDYI